MADSTRPSSVLSKHLNESFGVELVNGGLLFRTFLLVISEGRLSLMMNRTTNFWSILLGRLPPPSGPGFIEFWRQGFRGG